MLYFPATTGMVLIHAVFVVSEYALVKEATSNELTNKKNGRWLENQDIFDNIEIFLLVCHVGKTTALIMCGIALGMDVDQQNLKTSSRSIIEILELALLFYITIAMQTIFGFEVPKKLGISNAR